MIDLSSSDLTRSSGAMEDTSKPEAEAVAGTSTEGTSTEGTSPKWTLEADNSQVDDNPATLEMTAEGLNELMRSMETMLSDVEDLRSQCSIQARELLEAAMELKQQQDELKESYKELAADMQEVMDVMDDLCISKSAFEAREKDMEKLGEEF